MTREEKQTGSNLKINAFMESLPFVSVPSAKYSHMSLLEKILWDGPYYVQVLDEAIQIQRG